MKSLVTPKFWKLHAALPSEVQRLAAKAFELWQADTAHPSLHWKKAGKFWSVRINDDYRALAVVRGDTTFWLWIGPHGEYERMLRD